MSDLEARVERLERAVQNGLTIDLNEHNDTDQAEAKAKQDEQDAKAAEKQAEKAAADEAKAAAPAGKGA